jgi:phosphocarrier protein HPr
MYAKRVTLANQTGLHVRPATMFMKTASRFQSAIRVLGNEHAANGKSAISLMLLDAARGTELTIEAHGDDEIAAVEALVDLVKRCFGEIGDLPRDLPLFVARAGRDEMPGLNEALDRFVAAALAVNLPVTVMNHATGRHAFDVFDDNRTSRDIVKQVLAFLQFHLSA